MKAIVLGDHCTDVFNYGFPRGLSPEVPCPVMNFSHKTAYPGMAGNVARNLESLGFDVTLKCNMVDVKKIRYVDMESGHQFLRMDTPEKYGTWDRGDALGKYDVIVLADYGKGYLLPQDINNISGLAHAVPVYIDTKMKDLHMIHKEAVVKINRREYDQIRKGDCKCHLIVTLGKEGAMYIPPKFGPSRIFPGRAVHVFDLMGAGDTFMAVLVWAIEMKGFSIETAIEWANIGASLVVQKKGTAVVTEKELASHFSS